MDTFAQRGARRARQTLTPRPMEATVLDPPLTDDNFVRVEVAAQPGIVRECPWSSPSGTPAAGDPAVVFESDRGNLWALVWTL